MTPRRRLTPAFLGGVLAVLAACAGGPDPAVAPPAATLPPPGAPPAASVRPAPRVAPDSGQVF